MDDKQIARQFSNYNTSLRPDALKELKTLVGKHLDAKLLDRIVQYANELQTPNDIIEPSHIQNIVEMIMGGQSIRRHDQVLDKLVDQQNRSLIIIDPFELVTGESHKYQIKCTVQDRQQQYLKRLDHIRTVLQLDRKYVIGQSNDQNVITISTIGSVIGQHNKRSHILGLLMQTNRYFLSDGIVNIKIRLDDCINGHILDDTLKVGVINVGSVVILTGEWDESEGHFNVFQISLPYFNVRDKIQADLKTQDLKTQLVRDHFGMISKVYNNMQYFFNDQYPSLERQKALEIFQLPHKSQFSMWFLSNFSLQQHSTIDKFSQLLERTQTYKDVIAAPAVIFIFGRFTTQIVPDTTYGQDLIKVIQKHMNLLQNTLIFFVSSFDEFPCAYSMPHPPVNLQLLFKEPLPMMHALSNPFRMGVCGNRMAAIRHDIARDLLKQHIKQEQLDYKAVCETIVSQQYLGTYHSNKVAYKWNYDTSMHLDPSIEYIILADQTLQQFQYTTQTSTTIIQVDSTTIINPGNFSEKGEFCMMSRMKDRFKCETCSL